VKRGKKRADDPEGNDLLKIADEFGSQSPALGRLVDRWRAHDSFVVARLMHLSDNGASSDKETRLADLVDIAREFQPARSSKTVERFHVSVLDVDETGLIDIIAASKNEPLSKGLACQPGDILLSCMNPKIWRVAVIPNVTGSWSCSPEFVVLRPKKSENPWKVALALHHPSVVQAVQAMAKGTSSSRQRVPKERVLSVSIPAVEIATELPAYIAWREELYRKRMQEALAYDAIHKGESRFSW
jgi:hypothetical protein